MPDMLNPKTKEMLEKLGPFDYDKFNIPEYGGDEIGPIQMENDTVYVGQLKNNLKHGRGKLFWPDGSIYEGQWDNDISTGRGRLIHADGDYYEGEWSNSKA